MNVELTYSGVPHRVLPTRELEELPRCTTILVAYFRILPNIASHDTGLAGDDDV